MSVPQNVRVAAYDDTEMTFTWDDDTGFPGTDDWYQTEFRNQAQTYLIQNVGSRIGTYNFYNIGGGTPGASYEFRVREVYDPTPTTNVGTWSPWVPVTLEGGEPPESWPDVILLDMGEGHEHEGVSVVVTGPAEGKEIAEVKYRMDSGSWISHDLSGFSQYDLENGLGFDVDFSDVFGTLSTGTHKFEAQAFDSDNNSGGISEYNFTQP